MPKISMRLPTDADMACLAAHMRRSDVEELALLCGLPPLEAVIESVRVSDPDFLFAAHADGGLLCIGGCSVLGAPWLLGTELLGRHVLRLTRDARRAAALMLQRYPLLRNVIDARQERTITWLLAVGFRLGPAVELRPGVWVRVFEMGMG